ncbi:hypothetical protein QOT17_011364 [Balamuthia mandrillaris]
MSPSGWTLVKGVLFMLFIIGVIIITVIALVVQDHFLTSEYECESKHHLYVYTLSTFIATIPIGASCIVLCFACISLPDPSVDPFYRGQPLFPLRRVPTGRKLKSITALLSLSWLFFILPAFGIWGSIILSGLSGWCDAQYRKQLCDDIFCKPTALWSIALFYVILDLLFGLLGAAILCIQGLRWREGKKEEDYNYYDYYGSRTATTSSHSFEGMPLMEEDYASS